MWERITINAKNIVSIGGAIDCRQIGGAYHFELSSKKSDATTFRIYAVREDPFETLVLDHRSHFLQHLGIVALPQLLLNLVHALFIGLMVDSFVGKGDVKRDEEAPARDETRNDDGSAM